jgi:cell division protein FtsI/penicillin-binding protein 2
MLTLAAVLLVGVLVARAGYLGVVKGGELSDLAVGQQRSSTEALAPRGAIVTRDGHDLARDQLAVEVTATPALVSDPVAAAGKLGPILKTDPNELAEKLDGNGGYARLARAVAPDTAEKVADLDIPGIHFADTYQRFLPRGPVAAQIVGLTDEDRAGATGLEQSLDEPLTGTPGTRVFARDPFGRRLDTIVDDEPTPGKQVELTLDGVIQDRAERILVDTREEYSAKSAMAVVMRPDDGAILAMASVPRPNPNRRSSYSPELARNRPVTDTFEPGSTFKVVTIAGALEDGVVTPDTPFDLPPTLTLYDRELGEAHRDTAVRMSVSEILEQSSNVGTVKIAQSLGQERLQKWISRFGFGQPTGIDYPGEVPGLVLASEDWSGVSILNIPIGQGVGVTLTQLTRAYAAIANGGRLVTPHLVSRIGDEDVEVPPAPRVLNRKTARQVDEMLRSVVSPDGTGEAAKIEGYEVAGKTGTANKINPETGEYDSRYVASFVGYVPADDPQLLVAVVVDEPSGVYYGGAVAAPAFEQIARFSLQYLGIAP